MLNEYRNSTTYCSMIPIAVPEDPSPTSHRRRGGSGCRRRRARPARSGRARRQRERARAQAPGKSTPSPPCVARPAVYARRLAARPIDGGGRMRIRWYGQAAFLLTGRAAGLHRPLPRRRASRAREEALRLPPIAGVEADVLLVTHEHGDHNAVEAVGGSPHVVRSTAGTFETPIGEVVAVSWSTTGSGRARDVTRSFASSSTACGSATSETSGRTRCAPSSGGRSARSTPVRAGRRRGACRRRGRGRDRADREAVPRRPDALPDRGRRLARPAGAFLEALGAPVERIDGSVAEVEPLLGTHEFPRCCCSTPPARD